MPPGHALYPPTLTREAIEAYVAANPDKKAEIYNLYTVVHQDGDGNLSGRTYHDEYKPFADKAAAALRQAASLSDDPAFANFLRLRADALLDENYYPSDIAWIDLQNPKFDIIYGSQETYLDNLLGVKTSFGAAILIRNEAESQNLAKYQQWIGDLQDALADCGRGSALAPRSCHADGGDGQPVSGRRPPARLSGRGRQPAERPAHSSGEGHEEGVLQELHGRARQGGHPAARRAA